MTECKRTILMLSLAIVYISIVVYISSYMYHLQQLYSTISRDEIVAVKQVTITESPLIVFESSNYNNDYNNDNDSSILLTTTTTTETDIKQTTETTKDSSTEESTTTKESAITHYYITNHKKFLQKLSTIIIIPSTRQWMEHNIKIRSYPIWNTVYNRSNDLPCLNPIVDFSISSKLSSSSIQQLSFPKSNSTSNLYVQLQLKLQQSKLMYHTLQHPVVDTNHNNNNNRTIQWYNNNVNNVWRQHIQEGLFFRKLYKTASTTSASIHVRIARNLANRIHNNNNNTTTTNNSNDTNNTEYWPVCRTRHTHGSGIYPRNVRVPNKQLSFLWTMIRHPTDRYISEFFHFHISQQQKQNNSTYLEYMNNNTTLSKELLQYIRYGQHSKRHYLHFLSLVDTNIESINHNNDIENDSSDYDEDEQHRALPLHNNNSKIRSGVKKVSSNSYQYNYTDTIQTSNQLQQTIQIILNQYDFIGIMERFDESIVVLMLLLNIPMADVLYISSKLNGSYESTTTFIDKNNTNNTTVCTKIQPSIIPDDVQEYVTNSTDWYQYIEPENILYVVANKQLDDTINNVIGTTKFQQTLQLYLTVQKYIQLHCTYTTTSISFPCNPYNGILNKNNDCYHTDTDIGCGYTCLDTVATKFNLW